MISCKRLFLTIATASAPVPPPPSIITAGADVYPAPGSMILIEVRTEVLNSCKIVGKVISGFNV
jgi:hypothetical protein